MPLLKFFVLMVIYLKGKDLRVTFTCAKAERPYLTSQNRPNKEKTIFLLKLSVN